ncbi:hypothetical protein Tco_0514081 [Tanacetum coccineum]
MQTLIPTPPRSPRTILSSDKNMTQELTDPVPLPTTTTSNTPHSKQRISSLYNHLPEELIKNNLKPCIAATIIEDHDAFRLEVTDLISQEFNAQAPKIIVELFKNYVQSNVIQIHPTIIISNETSSSADLQQQLEDEINSHHDDHQEDDAPPEGEKRVKIHKTSKSSKSARGSSSKHSAKDSTTYVSKMRATLNDALSNQFKNAEEYAYHLEQTTNFIENQIVWESKQEDIRRPVPRPFVFFGP